MSERIYLSAPHMGGEEITFVQEAFAMNWIAPAGPHLTAFEEGLSKALEGHSVVALSSGTAAIHLALVVLGVQPTDEVICSSFTFAGSCNPIMYAHATPVFVDSEKETWNMDPHLLREAIVDRLRKGRKPKAIIVVHLYGMPAMMDEILAVAREFEIPVIEDAAEALGAKYKGRECGTLGDLSVLSFNGNKIITTSGGGAFISKNQNWIEQVRFLAAQARDLAPHYQHSQVGYNYRLSNVCAAIGLGQLKVLNERVNRRRQIFEFYRETFSKLPLGFQPGLTACDSNRWLTAVVFNDQQIDINNLVRKALDNHNIESRPLWKPMHLQPVYRDFPFYGTGVSEELFRRGLCLPSGSALTPEQLGKIGEVVKKSAFY